MDRQLPQDILVDILAKMPDLHTLTQAMRLSKRVYGAYQAHTRGISEAVARNQLGSEFDLAFRVVQEQLYSDEHPGLHPPEPDLARAPTGPISDVEIRRLSENVWAIRQIESFFSQRYKDRTATASQLDAVESRRLVRALYALWLMIDIFAPRWNELPVPPLTAVEMRVREALHARQRAFTFTLLPDEGARRDMINAFMFITKDVSSWVSVCCCNSITHADILFIFPRLSLNLTMLAHVLRFAGQRAYTPYTSYGHSPVYALREAFNRLVEDNTDNLGVQMLASQALGFLHGPAPMFEDACSRCSKVYRQTTYDPELFDSRNWHMLNGDIPLREIVAASFPGHILKNRCEQPIIAAYFEGPLLDRARTMQSMLSYSGQEVMAERWLCRICIKNLLSECAMAWWIDYLRNHGRDVESLPPCGSGHQCERQKTSRDHANFFNHYKEPN